MSKKPGQNQSGPRTEKALGAWFTPQQRDDFFIKLWNKIADEKIDLEAFGNEVEISYFNRPLKKVSKCEYDVRFHFDHGYDNKIRRDDRHNLKIVRENIFHEDRARVVPLVTSHLYGQRTTNLEGQPFVSHKRLRVMDEILRRHKINLRPTKKFPPDQGYPLL